MKKCIRYSACLCGVAIAISICTACKGRTMENMEPTGDTIEVVIMQPSPSEDNTETTNYNQEIENENP